MPVKKIESLAMEFKQVKLKYKDIFDMKEFYTAMREYLNDKQWTDYAEGNDQWETFYGEQVGQNGAKEVWIKWRVQKAAPDSNQIIYHLDLDYHCLGLSSTEIVKEGMKLKVNKGEMELTLKPVIEKVYEKKFKEDSILKYALDIFNQRAYRKELEERKKELYQEVYAMQNFIKQWFKMKRYLPYEESKVLYPSYAWPSHLKE